MGEEEQERKMAKRQKGKTNRKSLMEEATNQPVVRRMTPEEAMNLLAEMSVMCYTTRAAGMDIGWGEQADFSDAVDACIDAGIDKSYIDDMSRKAFRDDDNRFEYDSYTDHAAFEHPDATIIRRLVARQLAFPSKRGIAQLAKFASIYPVLKEYLNTIRDVAQHRLDNPTHTVPADHLSENAVPTPPSTTALDEARDIMARPCSKRTIKAAKRIIKNLPSTPEATDVKRRLGNRIREWQAEIKTQSPRKVKFADDERPKAKVEELEDIRPGDHAIINEEDQSEVSTNAFAGVPIYSVNYGTSPKRTTRGVRATIATTTERKESITGILTSRHLFPKLREVDITLMSITVDVDGKLETWNGDRKYTQLVTASHQCGVCNNSKLVHRIDGADAILIVDSRINHGRAFRIQEPKPDHSFYILSAPRSKSGVTVRVASQCQYDPDARSEDVCPGLYPLTGATSKNEGDSGLPVFQFINNSLQLVGINKGIDNRWASVKHSLVQTGLNLNWTRRRDSYGSQVLTGIPVPPCHPSGALPGESPGQVSLTA
jgi:hypothetical protein